ncbi:ornithine decarboxylase [Oreochromis niloticus]|uniref:ornithine decarboxylase n=1 Tax=Oreochromis niloticus TaxID=8128 RepID=UPI000904C597|nr:ornithine decarboxylase [Oreochromis niloticus]
MAAVYRGLRFVGGNKSSNACEASGSIPRFAVAGGGATGVHDSGDGGQSVFVDVGFPFRSPADITSDRGPQFVSELWSAMADGLGVKVHRTTAYHPQANGMCERFHRSLKAALRASLTGGDWVDRLPWVLLGLRSAVKEDLGVSPAELVLGQPLRVPGEFLPESPPPCFDPSLLPFRPPKGTMPIGLRCVPHMTGRTGFLNQGKDEPFYVLNLDDILEKHIRWITRLPRVKPFYAVKCNYTPAVIRMLNALDTGFDCASKAEIELALSLGVTPDKIIYAHPTKPRSHIRYARTHRVNVMTFDNEEELLKISLTHPQAKLVMRIAVDDSKSLLRLNAKFGVRLSSVSKLLECARWLNLEVIGVSFHVGSGCTGSMAFKQAITDARYAFDIANSVGFQMRLLDIGGGFPGREDFTEVKFEEFSEVINKALDELFPPANGLEIIAEPGRFYVDSAFTLAVNVIAKRVEDTDECSGKCLPDRKDYSSEKMMMYYINDGVYGSLSYLINDPAHTKVEPWPLRVNNIKSPCF